MSGKLFVLCYVIFQIITPIAIAQQEEDEFIYGVYLNKSDADNNAIYSWVKDSLKMNTVQQYSYSGNQTKLSGFNLIAVKDDSNDYGVYHYSNGYYTRWEAEDTTKNLWGTGLKANFGSNTIYNNINCWTTGNDTSNSSRIVLYGPHYRQDKVYKLGYLRRTLEYELKFSLAGTDIIIPPDYEPEDSICKVSVVFSYKTGGVTDSIILAEKIIYADSIFSSFTPYTLTYSYPESFCTSLEGKSSLIEYEILNYNDSEPLTGIQFQFTWYGKKQVYIDKFEVYDDEIGKEIVNRPGFVTYQLDSFANNYSSWSNLKYFFNISEPQTIDNYTPMRFVDSILYTNGHKTGIAEFYPQWNGWRNGDKTIEKFLKPLPLVFKHSIN